MANTADMYGKGIEHILDGTIDLAGDSFKVMLLTDGYTPSIDVHNDRADLSSEYSGSGYTTGGKAMVNDAVSAIVGGGKYDGDDLTWSSLATTGNGVKYIVLYKTTGVAANDLLVALYTLGNNVAPGGNDFTVQWHADGLLDAS